MPSATGNGSHATISEVDAPSDTLIAQAGTELEHGNDDGKASMQYLEGTVTRYLGCVEGWGSEDVHLMAFAPGPLFPWQQVNRYTETAGPHLLIYSC